jgi:hypothetical protein
VNLPPIRNSVILKNKIRSCKKSPCPGRSRFREEHVGRGQQIRPHHDEGRKNTTKRLRETEAEAVAFVICHASGLETGSAAQDYIQLYEGDANLLTESLERIQCTATQILNAITPDAQDPTD